MNAPLDLLFLVGVAALLLHAAAHTVLRGHPHIRFNTAFSRLWIDGGAVVGGLHLLLSSIV